MAYLPSVQLSTTFTQYPGYWLKFYVQGTLNPLSMATDAAAGTLLARAEISSGGSIPIGFVKTAGNAIFQPYLNTAYDAWIFPTSAEADANDTSNAIRIADNVDLQAAEEALSLVFTKQFDTVALMVASTTLSVGELVITAGYAAASDGGGNKYEVVSAGTGTVDGGKFINLATHQASAIIGNETNVVQWGAVRDGTDQTSIVQAAADFMRGNEALGPGPTFGGIAGGFVDVPQGVQWTAVGFTFRPNVTIRQDTGEHIRIYLNGENVSGAVNEWRIISGFHPGIIREVHTDYTIDTLGGSQILGNRMSDIWNVNGADVWQLANDIDNLKDDNLTLFALNPSKQTMHWHHDGRMRYGRMDNIQDFTKPVGNHTFNKKITHQEQAGTTLTHTMQIVSSGVPDLTDITGATQANPCVITTPNPHNMLNGAEIRIFGVLGMVELNNINYTIANVTATTFELSGIDSTGFSPYASVGGIIPQTKHSKIVQIQSFDGEMTILDTAGTTFIHRLRDDGSLKVASGISSGDGVSTTALASISNVINTANKDIFKVIGNVTTGRMVYASGTSAAAVWKFMDGTTAHTPI